MTSTTSTELAPAQIIEDMAMWAIDNDAELMLELAVKYYQSCDIEDLRDIHSRIYWRLAAYRRL